MAITIDEVRDELRKLKGELARTQRLRLGKTQEELCEELCSRGVSMRQYQRIEAGSPGVAAEYLDDVLEMLGVRTYPVSEYEFYRRELDRAKREAEQEQEAKQHRQLRDERRAPIDRTGRQCVRVHYHQLLAQYLTDQLKRPINNQTNDRSGSRSA